MREVIKHTHISPESGGGGGGASGTDAPLLLLLPRAQTKPTDAFETFLSVHLNGNKMSGEGTREEKGVRNQ